jgi:ATP-binding cassette subfamily C protein CydD
MKPLDPRLLKQAGAARRYVLLTAGLGIVTTAVIVAQALLLARVIAGVAMDGEGLSDVRGELVALGVIVGLRALVAGAQDRFGHRAATTVVQQLRERLVVQAVDRVRGAGAGRPDGGHPDGGRLDGGHPDGEGPDGGDLDGEGLTVLATRGLDALDGYLTRYLPQLLLAATVTPAVLAVIWWHDTTAGLTILVTLPLIPLFMALVGLSTQASADRSLRTLQRLGAQVLDLIAGLPTLRAFGVASGQAARVRAAGDAHRRATMRTLRSAFLSALVLETLTTLSVALVAVGIGLRLVYGGLDLQTGLAVLLLAPEVYLPLRAVGTQFHASVDGLAAAQQAFAILERPVPAPGTLPAPDLRTATIRFDGVSAVPGGTTRATPFGLDACARPGEILALAGPSGTGKSTAVSILLGLRRPAAGRVMISADGPENADLAAVDLADVEPGSWWRQIAWAPQHPALIPGTLADNVRLTAPGASDQDLDAAAAITGFDQVVVQAPGGWAAVVGQGGLGLSAGQRQRLALTRVLLRDAPLVVLDEPTAHLDAASEHAILAVLERLRAQGRTVVLVAHRPALAGLADRVVTVREGHLDAGPGPASEAASEPVAATAPASGTAPESGPISELVRSA